MSMGPFEAGFVSLRDNKQCNRKIMCTDDKIVYCFRSGSRGVVVCWEHCLVQVNLSFIHFLHICCHYRIARCYIDKKSFLLMGSFTKLGLVKGSILKLWAAYPYPKYSREPPPCFLSSV